MKNLSYVIFALVLTGCASPKLENWNSGLRTSGYDFRPYTEQGFLFTPEVYTDPYEAIGLIEITYIPSVTISKTRDRPDQMYGYRIMYYNYDYYYIELLDADKLIAEMFDLATEMGANTLSNFNITGATVYNRNIAIETVKASGFAIKRISN